MMPRLAFAALVTIGACALKTQGEGIHLDAIRPDSVRLASGAIVEVVLHGRGFIPGKPGQNTVMIGTYAVRDVPANEDGTEIRVVIPDALPSGGEAPPMQVDAGPLALRVKTSTGESNTATVRVIR